LSYTSGATFGVTALFRLCSIAMTNLIVSNGGTVTYEGTDVSVGSVTVQQGGTLRIIDYEMPD